MTAQKPDDPAAGKSTQPPGSRTTVRKPWKPKSPIEKFIEAGDSLRAQIADKEAELNELRKQLQKFESARKILEAS